ncbi:MAG: hypothetical protein ACYCZY_00240 [Lacisediminihabitans sp.]
MSERSAPGRIRARRRRGRVAFALLIVVLSGSVIGSKAAAADEPKVPEQVASYFATGLVPRLTDLYGPGAKAGSGMAFDETTKVGTIHRLLAWTADFLAGKQTSSSTELTNNWIAPVSDKDGTVLGLATVWINPGSDLPELATFDPGPQLAKALAAAPAGTLLVHDPARSAWFATDGKTVTPLVPGTSGLSAPTSPSGFQKLLRTDAAARATANAGTNPGLLVAGLTLGVVVVILGIFVLLPDRKRRARVGEAATVMAAEPPETGSDAAPAAATARKPAAKSPSSTAGVRSTAPKKNSAVTTAKPRTAGAQKATKPVPEAAPKSGTD